MLPLVLRDDFQLVQVVLAILDSAVQDHLEDLFALLVGMLQLVHNLEDVFLDLHPLHDEISKLSNTFLVHPPAAKLVSAYYYP